MKFHAIALTLLTCLILQGCGGQTALGMNKEKSIGVNKELKAVKAPPVFNLKLSDLDYSYHVRSAKSMRGVASQVRKSCKNSRRFIIDHVKGIHVFRNDPNDQPVDLRIATDIEYINNGLIKEGDYKALTKFTIVSKDGVILGEFDIPAMAKAPAIGSDFRGCRPILDRSIRKFSMLTRNKYLNMNFDVSAVDAESANDVGVGTKLFGGLILPFVPIVYAAKEAGSMAIGGVTALGRVAQENPELARSVVNTADNMARQAQKQTAINNRTFNRIYQDSVAERERHAASQPAEYEQGAARSAAYKKRLEQGGIHQASSTGGSSDQPSTGSYKQAKTSTPSYNATADQNNANTKQSAPPRDIFCPPVGLQFADYNSTNPLSINMTCPAFNQCVWENTGAARRGNGQIIENPKGWGDKQPANTSACRSLESSCLDTFRKRAWGKDYGYCKANMNQSHDNGISQGSSK